LGVDCAANGEAAAVSSAAQASFLNIGLQ